MTASPRPSLAVLREAIQKRVDETSLRATADEIGLPTFSALRLILTGKTKNPQRSTMRLIMKWYYTQSAGQPKFPATEIEMATALLEAWAKDPDAPKNTRRQRVQKVMERLSGDER